MKHLAVIIVCLPMVFGCDPKSDMGQQPKYKPYAPNPTMADGASARPLIAGTVPRDPATVPGNAYLASTSIAPAGTSGTVEEAARIPQTIYANLIARGQQQFDIFCSTCHGRLGNGMGMIAQRGFMHPPSFHIDRLRQRPDGHFYNIITAGYGAMYSYADKISPADRWAVVAYVRALQAAGQGNLAEPMRATLHGAGDAKPKTAGYRQ